MEETTTSTQVDDSAVDTAVSTTTQADTSTDEQAVETDASSPKTEEQVEETSDETSEAAEIKAWAEKKGLPLDDPLAMAKMVREGDKKVTEAGQSAKLDTSVKTASANLDEVQQLRNEVAVINFFQKYPDARELETDMAKIVEERPYLASDLDALYFYTKGIQADTGLVAAKQAGSKEALAAVAKAERAGAPKASATTRTTPTKLTNEDIKKMSLAEYQQAKADGKIDPFGPSPE